jgi:hypothetical protein
MTGCLVVNCFEVSVTSFQDGNWVLTKRRVVLRVVTMEKALINMKG